MRNSQKGFAVLLVLIMVVLIGAGGAGYYALQKSREKSGVIPPAVSPEASAMMEKGEGGSMMKKEEGGAMKPVLHEVEIAARNFSFSVKEIRVKKGDRVRIKLSVEEGFHSWALDEFRAHTRQMAAGESEVIEFVAAETGMFEYYCSVGSHRAMGMVGKLVVEEEEGAMKEKLMIKSPTITSISGDEAGTAGGHRYGGAVLAGYSSPLLDFKKADYDAALATNKLIVLYFYANWCPICRVEFPKMKDAFDELSGDNVVGFRVNYNDSDTDQDERNLAREHGVAYQHTKVFVKNGSRILKAPESWEKDRYISEITKAR